jgi:hypothetical protein
MVNEFNDMLLPPFVSPEAARRIPLRAAYVCDNKNE